MDNIFNPTYRAAYFTGYCTSMNPTITIQPDLSDDSEAFIDGFNAGRMDYESWNGSLDYGIALRVITKNVLEDFLLSGLLGLNIDTNDYTPYQLNILSKWYQSGTEKYEPKNSLYLFSILEENRIQICNETFYL